MSQLKAHLLCLGGREALGFKEMFAKMLLAWGMAVLCLTLLGHSQDPLGTEMFNMPSDLRRTSSLDDGDAKVYLDPMADPLSIDPLIRSLDPEHTWDYLAGLRGRYYAEPGLLPQADLRGGWRLELQDSGLGQLDLTLIQNRDAVFGRGMLTRDGTAVGCSATGQIVWEVLYLDVLSEDLHLHRCTLTIAEDRISGGYYAFDPLGRVWTGSIRGGRSG
jgi:hypothetical protein